MIRSTTTGILKNYRFNLQRSAYTRNQAQNTVMTGRQFNSYAEDPATASRAFKLRSSLQRTESQAAVGSSVVRKYEIAWSTISAVTDQANTAKDAITRAANDPTAYGRHALGQELQKMADGMVKSMNAKYGDNFVFAGADGKNAPFKFDNDGNLTFRGIKVDCEDGSDEYEQLKYLAKDEAKYVDLGLGLEENAQQELNSTSAYNISIQGITYLGYGEDAEGLPNNLACIVKKMGDILVNCDENGNFADGDEATFEKLSKKFDTVKHAMADKYTALDTEAAFLKQNQTQLENSCNTLQEQISELEDVDAADAITAYSWAQYCYNAALKVGNSILSQSLMDYMNS